LIVALQRTASDLGHESLSDWCAAAGNVPNLCGDVLKMMDDDVKATGLKQLQGLVWEAGYKSGELVSHVYDDLPPALKRWNAAGRDVRIYSSGSVQAQKLFFGHTAQGDLLHEPCIDILADEKQVLEDVAADELALGINENRPNLIKYTDALWQNNFDIQTAFPAQSIDKSREQITIWAYDVAATWRGLPYKGMGNLIMESLRFAKRELKALLLNGVPYIKIRLKSPKERTARNLWAVLLWCETELIFLTRKREA
jgi:hypothetical protein